MNSYVARFCIESAKKAQNIAIAPLFLIFIFLLLCNGFFPTQSDDIGASFHPLSLDSFLNSYLNWNGRLGEMNRAAWGAAFAATALFPLVNAFVGLLFIVLFFFLVFGRMPRNNLTDIGMLSGILLIILLKACFGSVFFWAAGSFNYLYTFTFVFLFLLPYRMFWGGGN